MSDEEPERIIRRILVALDASSHSLAALEAAAALAARFEAEMLGLFVEDENLLRLAELPFAHELSPFSAARRRLDVEQVQRELRVQARRARQVFSLTIQRTKLRGSFRVARGAVVPQLLAAASEVDVVVLGKAGRSPTWRKRLGSTVRAVLWEAPSVALVLQEGACLKPPVMVVYDGSDPGERALAVAAAVAGKGDDPLVVLAFGEVADVERLHERVRDRLGRHGFGGTFQVLDVGQAKRLAELARGGECGMLILPAEPSFLRMEPVRSLLEESEVPVMLVR